MKFPDALVVVGPKPIWKDPDHPPKCRTTGCDLTYAQHTGRLCAICKHPVEHHDPDQLDAEIAGSARMAESRLAAGLTLQPHEQWCLEHRKDPHE